MIAIRRIGRIRQIRKIITGGALTMITIATMITMIAMPLITGASAAPYTERDRELIITGGITVIEAEWFDCDGGIESGAEMTPRLEITENAGRNDAPYPNYNVGYINAGDYLRFTVYVETDGYYRFDAWVASGAVMPGAAEFVILSMNNKNIGFAEPSQDDGAGWHTWYLETAGTANLTAGTHIIRVNFPFGAINFDAFVVTRIGDMIDTDTIAPTDETDADEYATGTGTGTVTGGAQDSGNAFTDSDPNTENEASGTEVSGTDELVSYITRSDAGNGSQTGSANMLLWLMIAAAALAMIVVIIILALDPKRIKT